MSRVEPFSISRELDAPRELVYQACTDVAHLSRWMGPAGSTVLHAALDLRVGGRYHYGLRGADGTEMWGRQVFRELVFPERMVYVQSFSDEHGGLSRHPLSPTWPLEMLATVTFEDLGGRTRMTISWEPLEADEAALATFDAARGGMSQGFAGTFANLERHLAATERRLVNSRVIDAPRARVWEALTDPAQVNAWWGPDGFTNVEVSQDVRVGGEWKFVMVGPDGVRYPNLATYLVLEEPSRIVYDHGDFETVMFRAEITLEDVGDKTLVTLGIECASREERDGHLKHGAVQGGQQTLGKLAAFVRAG